MQHDPDYEHYPERVRALEQMVDRHTVAIERIATALADTQQHLKKLVSKIEDMESDDPERRM